MTRNNDWKTKTYLIGTFVGAAIGFGTAYLFARSAEERGDGAAPRISTADAIKSAVGVIGIMRGIAALGDK